MMKTKHPEDSYSRETVGGPLRREKSSGISFMEVGTMKEYPLIKQWKEGGEVDLSEYIDALDANVKPPLELVMDGLWALLDALGDDHKEEERVLRLIGTLRSTLTLWEAMDNRVYDDWDEKETVAVVAVK